MKVEEKKQEWIVQPIFTVNGGRMLKRYQKIKIVGEGSYSKCWLVRTDNSQSTYVVKIIPKKKLQMLVKQKLVYEIRIHQLLSHQNVVHLDHWFEDQGYQYIFMEYCSQGNLEKELQSKSHMSEKQIKKYGRQAVEAIRYIHSKNILHRDLKLCNFYLDDDKNIKLGDFGFACQLSHQGELKRQTCGTPNYIAPQAVSGFGYSFSSDIWAVGVILYRLKYKECPFEAKSVKGTIEKVKTCQYDFPKGIKISSDLKDLIEKIFVINYDERLTLDQILAHPFFQEPVLLTRPKSQAKGGFSMFRNIFSRQKDSRKSPQRPNRIKGSEKKVEAKRSNSCQTFKQIKQILKNKSKPSLIHSTQMRTEQNSTINYTQVTGREKSFIGGNTMRSIADTSFGLGAINKRLEGTARMNTFLGTVKQQLKIQSKPHVASKQQPSSSQQFGMVANKFYLPFEVHFQKDVVIVGYRDSIKQVIYRNSGLIVHRTKNEIYDMNGQLYRNPPKVLKYIVQNRVEVAEAEPDEQQFGQNTLQKILLFVAHRWIIVKDGIILMFGSGVFVAKMTNQQLFYIGSISKQVNNIKQDGKISMMYTKQSNGYKCAEGVVLSRIYQGWIASTLKHGVSNDK